MPLFNIEVAQVTTRMGRFVVHADDPDSAETVALTYIREAPSVITWDGSPAAASVPEIVSCQQRVV